MDDLDKVLSQLNTLQLRFVEARVDTRFDGEAADIAGCSPVTPRKWRQKGIPIDEAVQLLIQERIKAGVDSIRAAVPEAVAVLVEEVRDKGSEKIRAALAILDRAGIPPTTRIEAEVSAAGFMVVLDDPDQL